VILIALRTLATFRMGDDTCLLPFVKGCLLKYLEHANTEVRIQAVVAICQLLADAKMGSLVHHKLPTTPRARDGRGTSTELLHDGLSSLLELGLRDPEAVLRRRLLFELKSKPVFDRWLRQPFHLQSLLLFLSDVDLRVKVIATSLLGAQCYLNPGFLMPKLRLHLRHLIVDLQLHQDINAREEAAKLLCEFIRAPALRKLVRPLTHTLVNALPLNAPSSGSSNRLTTAALELLGEICLVDDITPYLPNLFPVILTAMQDKSSSRKREVLYFYLYVYNFSLILFFKVLELE
jgi:hypothetical protein